MPLRPRLNGFVRDSNPLWEAEMKKDVLGPTGFCAFDKKVLLTNGGTTTTDMTATSAGVVGMEVERSTDGADGLGRDATGVPTMGLTDTAAAGAGVDVATTGGGKKKRRKNKNRKHGGKHPSRGKRL